MMNNKDHDHLHLLCDIGELAALLSETKNIESFFKRTVELVTQHMKANICAIYLLDEKSNVLTLKTSVGLSPDNIGKTQLKIGEGPIGVALEKLEPVKVGRAGHLPGLETISAAGGDALDSLLAVPIRRVAEQIGVLVVQHQERDYFDDMDVMAMRAIASQLAGAIGNARLLISPDQIIGKESDNRIPEPTGLFKGLVASYGFAFAPVTVVDKRDDLFESGDITKNREYTLSDFHQAIKDTTGQLQELQSRFTQRLAESASLIFTAHLMILKDERFTCEMEKLINNGVPVAQAVITVAKHYVELFGSSKFEHIREKANDVKDLAGRLLRNLQYGLQETPSVGENRIVIATDLYPSDVLRLASEEVKGIVLISGGVTSHVAIIARSLQIPLIIVNHPELLQLSDGTPMIVDGESENIYIHPSEEVIRQFRSRNENLIDTQTLSKDMSQATCTKDGVRIRLLANVNLLEDLALARELKAEGIGLYRTEFPFLIRSVVPSEEEQFLVYKRLFDKMAGKEVTIRVLDIGSDKLSAYSDTTTEANPALGLRALRFLFRHREVFNQQLRAILRAAVGSQNPRIMFPLISSLDDFLKARQMVYDCLKELEHENLPHHHKPLTGALIELPCLVEIIDSLAAEADFLSIGTNDFIQYMLAVDRTNEKVAEYFQPFHPAVLKSLARIAKAANDRKKEISVCGEVAHDPEYIPFLLGIGIRTLSVYPKFLPYIQKEIQNLSLPDAESYAERLLDENSIAGTERVLQC